MKTKSISNQEFAKLFYTPNVKLLGDDSGDVWFAINGNVSCAVLCSDEKDGYNLINYEVTLDQLRDTKTPFPFWNALFSDGDVNHSLSSDNIPRLGSVKLINSFFDGSTNVPPVTACGMVNFVIDHLHQRDINEDELLTIKDAENHIFAELSKLNMDSCDIQSITDSIAEAVYNDAVETCGDTCTMSDIDIAFHRELMRRCNVDEN